MTTTVKIHVNGRYRAIVRQSGNPDVEVHGNYEGSPNPSGEHTFYLQHGPEGTKSIFEVEEHHIPEEDPKQVSGSDLGTDK